MPSSLQRLEKYSNKYYLNSYNALMQSSTSLFLFKRRGIWWGCGRTFSCTIQSTFQWWILSKPKKPTEFSGWGNEQFYENRLTEIWFDELRTFGSASRLRKIWNQMLRLKVIIWLYIAKYMTALVGSWSVHYFSAVQQNVLSMHGFWLWCQCSRDILHGVCNSQEHQKQVHRQIEEQADRIKSLKAIPHSWICTSSTSSVAFFSRLDPYTKYGKVLYSPSCPLT